MEPNARTEPRKLRGLPLKLKEGIDAGAELTVKEWAEELGVKETHIRTSLTRLRQFHGYHQYHPTGTKKGMNGGQGVIIDINTKKEYITETMDKQKNVYLNPQIKAFSSWLETGYRKYPELRQAFKAYLSDEISKLTILDEQLKSKPTLLERIRR